MSRGERGAALVEFALVSVVLYLLLAGAIDFGRLMFDADAVQDVARLAARELAVAPVRANATFDYALSCDPASDPTNCLVDLKARVFDPACLVVDLNDPAVAARSSTASLRRCRSCNRALRSVDDHGAARVRGCMRYAGALVSDGGGARVQRGRPERPGGADGSDRGDSTGQLTRRERRRNNHVGPGASGDACDARRRLSAARPVQSCLRGQRRRLRSTAHPIRCRSGGSWRCASIIRSRPRR